MFASDSGFVSSATPKESPVLTQDGRVWPTQRKNMKMSCMIRRRMIEDLNGRPAAEGMSSAAAYLSISGWTCAQIEAENDEELRRFARAYPPVRKGDWVQTYSGRQFWPLDPRQEEVEIEDIAHSLSMQCRYNGHSLRFYSVAEHSWRLSFLVPEEFALEALLHDAAEAYICDIPRPLKPFLTGYAAIEEGVERVIAARFSLVYPWPQEVKDADARILVDEKEWLMSASPAEWDLPLPGFDIGVTLLRPLWPEAAKSAFLIRYHQLKGGVS